MKTLEEIIKKEQETRTENGEYYDDCWETDENTFNIGNGGVYNISPVYEQIDEDEFEIVDYEII